MGTTSHCSVVWAAILAILDVHGDALLPCAQWWRRVSTLCLQMFSLSVETWELGVCLSRVPQFAEHGRRVDCFSENLLAIDDRHALYLQGTPRP